MDGGERTKQGVLTSSSNTTGTIIYMLVFYGHVLQIPFFIVVHKKETAPSFNDHN